MKYLSLLLILIATQAHATRTGTYVEKTERTEEVPVDRTKHNILFVYAQKKVVDVSVITTSHTASVTEDSDLVPGIGYQHLFNNGIMLGAGIDTTGSVQVQAGLGF